MPNLSCLIKWTLLCWLLIACSTSLANNKKHNTKSKKKAKTVIVTVSGIKGDALINVNNRLKSVLEPINRSTDANKVNFFYLQAKQDIKNSIEPFGYFKATVHSTIRHVAPHWYISFNIKAGPQMKVSKVRLLLTGPGIQLKAFKKFKKNIPVKAGKPLNVNDFNKAKSNFMAIANRLGFFQAQAGRSRLVINLRSYTAKIVLRLKTGKRYKFGYTYFSPSRYNQSFLRRYMTYRTGDWFNDKKLQKMQNDLSSSPYFSEVDVKDDPNPAPPPYIVPIKVKTTSAKSQHYTIGGGWGSDTGPRLNASATWLRLTHSGQRLNINTTVSKNNNYILANYIIPGRHPATSYYTISTGAGELSLPNVGDAKSAKAGISYNTKLGGFNQRISLEYLVERYNIKQLPASNTHMLMPGISWTKRQVRGGTIPKSGYNINLQLTGANKAVASKASFFQSLLKIKALMTMPTQTRFIVGGQIGHTSIKNINQLPLSMQFLAGGGNTLRGYGYQSIGPGRNIIIGNFEIQQKIWRNLYLVGFYDVGNVSDEYYGKLKQSAGPGIALLTPIGTIEFTIAKPLLHPKEKWRLQFSIAPTI